jgi:hypothetical protein
MVHYFFVARARLTKYLLCQEISRARARSRKMQALLFRSTTLALDSLTLQQLRSAARNRGARPCKN